MQERQTRQNSGGLQRGSQNLINGGGGGGGGGSNNFLILRDNNIHFLEFIRYAIKIYFERSAHNLNVHAPPFSPSGRFYNHTAQIQRPLTGGYPYMY